MQAQKKRGAKSRQVEEYVPAEADSQMAGEDQEELDMSGPMPLHKLEQHGIASGDIKKFTDAGYHTVEAICYVPKKTLVNVKGISEAKLEKILEAANKEVKMNFMSAGAYLEQTKDRVQIRTGSD